MLLFNHARDAKSVGKTSKERRGYTNATFISVNVLLTVLNMNGREWFNYNFEVNNDIAIICSVVGL
jgi:hypothetical protein